MERNMAIVAKKFWKIVRVAYFMLRKGVSKGKVLADLTLLMNRGKIARKLEALHNYLSFHHHHHHHSDDDPSAGSNISFPTPLNEYEFSCSNTPARPTFHIPFLLNKRKHSKAPAETPTEFDGKLMAEVMEMMMIDTPTASPALPGFGHSPIGVRKLRVTDSPFPLDRSRRLQEEEDEL